MSDNDEDNTTLNMEGLEKLNKLMKNRVRLNVGILGPSTREEGGATNAMIGAAHEFGTSTLPIRSWLRMPLTMFFNKRIGDAITKQDLAKAIKSGTMQFVMMKAGVVAEGIISDAFDTGGFGTWVPSDMRRKQNHQTLVETQQLRNAVTSEVVDE